MLRIRFSRTGKVGQPSFRIVLQEHRSPVKGRALEILGHYIPTGKKSTVLNKERIAYWISKGALPSDTTAAFFKKEGMENMDRYLEPRNKKRRPKNEGEQKEEAPKEAVKPTEEKAAA